MRTVLFVCTGNTCRSPMAEAIARHALNTEPALASAAHDVFVASAGVFAADGVPTSVHTLEALAGMNLEFEGRSKRLSAPMIRKAAHVLCMTASHQAAARDMVRDSPEDVRKITLLDPGGRDIADPIGMGAEAYHSLARQLAAIVPQRLRGLLLDERPVPPPPASGPASAGRRHTSD